MSHPSGWLFAFPRSVRARVGLDTHLGIVIKALGDESTEVRTFHAVSTWKAAARAVEAWVRDRYTECRVSPCIGLSLNPFLAVSFWRRPEIDCGCRNSGHRQASWEGKVQGPPPTEMGVDGFGKERGSII
jgi:hypothetical protein